MLQRFLQYYSKVMMYFIVHTPKPVLQSLTNETVKNTQDCSNILGYSEENHQFVHNHHAGYSGFESYIVL